jgi:hypothetical protein
VGCRQRGTPWRGRGFSGASVTNFRAFLIEQNPDGIGIAKAWTRPATIG